MPVGKRLVVFEGRPVWRRFVRVSLLACLAVFSVVVVVPDVASAESLCTDTWTGPGEGLWQTPADWSTGVVPTSSDVACIGSGKTVEVRAGEKDQVGVLQGEGAVAVTNGTLEVTNLFESSAIKDVTLSGASSAVGGAGILDVTGSFTWLGGVLDGSGSLVILPGATASLASSGVYAIGSHWLIDNEGTMTLSHGQLWMNEESELKNVGTLKLNSENGIVVGGGKPSVVNLGTLEKTEGAWASQIQPNFTNEGTVAIHSGSLKLLSENTYLESGSTIEGEVIFNGKLVTVKNFHAESAKLVLDTGGFEILGGNTLPVGSFALDGGAIQGAGSIVMSGSFTWKSSGVMTGSGSTIIPGGKIVSLKNGVAAFGGHRVLINEGTIYLLKPSQIWINESAEFRNIGSLINTEGSGIRTESGAPTVNNSGVFQQTGATEEVPVEANMISLGAIIEANKEEKGFIFIKPVFVEEASNRYGPYNPSALVTNEPHCGDPINCVTGNYTETEKDLRVAGRGPGLNLTRSYNAEAAATATSHGMFGYGWSSTYSNHLLIESSAHRVVLVQANGSTVPFTETEAKTFEAPSWTQDALTGNTSGGFTLTLANQTKYVFSGSGRLESETDRNGNKISLSYNGEGKLVKISDPFGRELTLSYNTEGLVESAKDPLGHVVKYVYESGNLTSVTLPGETKPNWHFKYDSAHRITTMINGLGGETANVYDSLSRVTSQTDPLGHKLKFEYKEFRTKVTNEATGEVTVDRYNSGYSITSVTKGSGTSYASTTSFTYNERGEPTSITDGNGHATTFEYDSAGDRIKRVTPEGHETKWMYNGTHDVIKEKRPNGEETTIERDEHGDPTKISRPAPGATTQETKLEYNINGQPTSVTDPLGRVWKYEYDGYGDRTAEIDPEGDKSTWSYDEDAQETSTTSPRGNITGANAAEYTTTIERDAQERPTAVDSPGSGEGKPVSKVGPSIAGVAQEGQTLTAAIGIWEGALPIAYGYQWEHCNASGAECTSVTGATKSEYTLGHSDVGFTMRAVITATNSIGSTTNTSGATTHVLSISPVFVSQFGSKGSENGQFVESRSAGMTKSGNIDVLDSGNNRVQEFSQAGKYEAKFGSAGSGVGQMSSPYALTVDSKGNVWVTDWGNNRVEEFNEKNEFVRTFGYGVTDGKSEFEICTTGCRAGVAGSGAGQFKEPKGIAVTATGNVYVGDAANNRIEEFKEKGEFVAIFGYGVSDGKSEPEICTSSCRAGVSGSGNGQFNQPRGLAAGSGGNVYVVDSSNSRVQEFNEKNEYILQFGTAGTGNGQFKEPKAITVTTSGNVIVADSGNSRVEVFSSTGGFLTTFGTKGTGSGQFEEPLGIAVAANENLYIPDGKNNRVQQWRPAGVPSNTVLPSASGELITGQALRAGAGTWSAVPEPAYTYQWQRCNSSGAECANISGATNVTYVLAKADVGATLRVAVTTTNSAGNATGTSPVTETVSGPRITKYAYDADGNLESTTDPNGHTTKYVYDAHNKQIKTEEPNGTVTETGYDGAGQIISQTDGNKHTTKYLRNALEQVTEVIDPLSRNTTKEYDAAGNLISMTDPARHTTTYTYDHDNEIIEISYSDGKTPNVKYEYDADGNRTKMTDGTGTTTETYDQLDRLAETKDGHGNTIKYTYDLADEQTQITYPNGKTVERSYDKAGRVEKIKDWLEHTTKFSYSADSELTATVFPTATSEEDTYAYNNSDQMTEVKMSKGTEVLASLGYAHDNDGQVQKVVAKSFPGEETTEYTYDENNRLTKASGTTYGYDAANDPTTIGSGTFKYDNANELETGPSLKYTYNENGERTKTTPTSGPATTYGYDQAGNLITVERPKEGETAKIEDTYTYNGDGLRASETIASATSYLAWDIGEPLPTILNDGTNNYVYGPDNLPLEQINNTTEKVQYLHHDQAGSTRLLTGSTGTVTGKCSYSAYGTPTCEGTTTTPLGYDAQYTSSDTGLIYMRARVYDPATAQFLTVDPLDQWTHAPYTYASDNPLNYSDPSGLFPWESIAEGLGVGASCLLGPEVCVPVGLGVLDAHVIAADISSAETGCSPWPEIVPALVGAGVGALPFAGGVVAKHVWEASEWAYRLGVGAGLTAGGLAGTAASSSASSGGGSHGGSSSCGCSTG